jgi:diacylglycerol kinase (ATP)
MRPPRSSIGRIVLSFARAFIGIGFLLREPNARIHVAAALTVTGAGLLAALSRVEWAVVLASIGLVFALETLNTALEGYVDLAAPGRHETAGRAKDAAAGAVLLASFTSVGVAVILFGPRLGALREALGQAWTDHPLAVGLYIAVTLTFLLAGVLWRDKWPA